MLLALSPMLWSGFTMSKDLPVTCIHLTLTLMTLTFGTTISFEIGRHLKGPEEFCQLETFVASCESDEVILLESALYGRMHLGRCVQGDLGYIGCSANVLEIADRKCSGRHRCEIRIPNEEFEKTKPCYQELKSFFEASYACVKVATLDGSLCQSCDSIKLTSVSGFIGSVITERSGCGAASCPWIIEAQPGQIINITMYDFTRQSSSSDHKGSISHTSGCTQSVEYVYIKEEKRTQSVTVCAGMKRQKHIYLSLGHSVQITISSQIQRKNKGHFLIRYDVVGCPDIEVRTDMWFRREGDGRDAVVGCTLTDRKWRLSCVGHNWVGEIGNCTSQYYESESAQIAVGGLSVAYGTAIVIIVLVAIAVGILILALGLIAWRWHKHYNRRLRNRRRQMEKAHELVKQTNYDLEPVENLQNYIKHARNCPYDTYVHVWDRPLPQPEPGSEICTHASEDPCAHRAHLLATYGATEFVCGDKTLHPIHTVDSCTTTYTCNPPETLDTVCTTAETPRYFELEQQL